MTQYMSTKQYLRTLTIKDYNTQVRIVAKEPSEVVWHRLADVRIQAAITLCTSQHIPQGQPLSS